MADGEKLEAEMNAKGPGKAFFKSVDMVNEEAIKVVAVSHLLTGLIVCLSYIYGTRFVLAFMSVKGKIR